MWSPTHCSVTVQRARGLLTKGKNGTNNCFVTIALGREKYQTSVKEKAETNVNWNEECELKIPDQGNRAELTLTCLHRNNLGIDEFLGQVTLPLKDMDVHDRPRARWLKLESKPGKEKKNKERGELEVRIAFVVKSGSLTDLSKKDKHKSSIGQLASSVGGSLLSIGQGEKRKSIKKLAGSLSSKLHIRSKKKHADGDDNSSFSGSFASIGTPNSSASIGVHGGSGRRRGQRAGEADPGVISEDEDEFVFDNLSHKSSGSSLNIQRSGLQAPTQNFAPRNPSPLLSNNNSSSYNGRSFGKQSGGKPTSKLQETLDEDDDRPIDAEMEQLEIDFSVRGRTLPPPSKPPRTPHSVNVEPEVLLSPERVLEQTPKVELPSSPKLDEWESKLYGGNGKFLDIGSTDSLKRRSWELARVPLPTSEDVKEYQPEHKEKQQEESEKEKEPIGNAITKPNPTSLSCSSSSSSSSDSEYDEKEKQTVPSPKPQPPMTLDLKKKEQAPSPFVKQISLLSPVDGSQRNFDDFNASFAKFEQRNSSIFSDEDDVPNITLPPKPKPRVLSNEQDMEAKIAAEEKAKAEQEAKAKAKAEEEAAIELARQRRIEEDARLEAELRLNEQRLREEEAALQHELEEQRRRDAKRREEDQRILSFAKRSTSMEEATELPQQRQLVSSDHESIEHNFLTPEQSPKEFISNGGGSGNGERWEKRLGKFKYGNKRDKNNDNDSNSPSPKSSERIIIGHEKSISHAERRSEISAQLAKKYEGKSREELMLIANGMENEALLQRQRVKELEDYLDNLLLRVMETHPKILQNPYSRTTSAKSG
ncbi:rab11 family-interacting protein 1 isoform X2 [Scaptodrosophila lebanonensis]|uniref:Rab11 family-interacting protein 1 isoform X2 n=1 Tax=Drosophila lebanonensis TaxID=7225 RepID=A0A6J2TR17_DROLE|nr:rab11 family-interacting protein 1 isoform X2 [Scaptodrosophila lebanonensis]